MLKYEVPWKVIGCLGLGAAGLCAYQYWSMSSSSDTKTKESQAISLSRLVSLDLPELEGRPKLVVAPFGNDSDGILAAHLREWVGRRNVQLVEPGWLEQAVDVTGLREPGSIATELRRAAASMDSGYVLVGEVQEWTTWPPNEARLRSQVQLVDVASGKAVYDRIVQVPELPAATKPVTNESVAPAAAATLPQTDPVLDFLCDPLVVGITVWLLVVMLAPWLFAGAMTSVLRRESNIANALLVGSFALITGYIGWLSWGQLLEFQSAWLIVVLASLLTVPYLGHVCQQLERSQT